MIHKSNSINLFRFKMLLFLSFIMICGVFISVISLDSVLFLACISILPSILVLLYQNLIKETEIFTPLNFVLVNIIFGVTLQTFYLLYLDKGENRFGLYGLSSLDSLYIGMLSILISVSFLLIGYTIKIASVSKWRKSQPSAQWRTKKVLTVSAFLVGVSLISITAYLSVFGIDLNDLAVISAKRKFSPEDTAGTPLGYVRLGASLAQTACLILYTHMLTSKKTYTLRIPLLALIAFTFVLSILLPFVSSQRSSIIYFIISMVIINNYCSKKWTVSKLKFILIIILSVLIGMGALRFANGRDNAINYYLENAGAEHIVSTIAGSANLLSISKTGILIESIPEKMDYQYGKTYGLWLITPIPRSMWPEKPIVRIGGILGPTIYNTPDTSGVPPGFIGEAYLNFGWFGIPILSLIFGAGLRLFYDSIGRFAYQDHNKTLIYASLFTLVSFSSLSSDFTGLVSRGLQVYIPIYLALYLLRPRR